MANAWPQSSPVAPGTLRDRDEIAGILLAGCARPARCWRRPSRSRPGRPPRASGRRSIRSRRAIRTRRADRRARRRSPARCAAAISRATIQPSVAPTSTSRSFGIVARQRQHARMSLARSTWTTSGIAPSSTLSSASASPRLSSESLLAPVERGRVRGDNPAPARSASRSMRVRGGAAAAGAARAALAQFDELERARRASPARRRRRDRSPRPARRRSSPPVSGATIARVTPPSALVGDRVRLRVDRGRRRRSRRGTASAARASSFALLDAVRHRPARGR